MMLYLTSAGQPLIINMDKVTLVSPMEGPHEDYPGAITGLMTLMGATLYVEESMDEIWAQCNGANVGRPGGLQ